MAAHEAPPSLGFSRQEHWSGLPFPSPMHESEKWKWSGSVMSDSATSWTVAYQAPLSMWFSRQEYWSGMPLPSPRSPLSVHKYSIHTYIHTYIDYNWLYYGKTVQQSLFYVTCNCQSSLSVCYLHSLSWLVVGTNPILHRAQPRGGDRKYKRGKPRGIIMTSLGSVCSRALEVSV